MASRTAATSSPSNDTLLPGDGGHLGKPPGSPLLTNQGCCRRSPGKNRKAELTFPGLPDTQALCIPGQEHPELKDGGRSHSASLTNTRVCPCCVPSPARSSHPSNPHLSSHSLCPSCHGAPPQLPGPNHATLVSGHLGQSPGSSVPSPGETQERPQGRLLQAPPGIRFDPQFASHNG